jgi:hypothetical protein
VDHDGSSAYNRAFADLDAWENHRADADVRIRADRDPTADDNSRRNVAVVSDLAVVLDNSTRIDDAVHANARLSI